jgi:hypothetical protein
MRKAAEAKIIRYIPYAFIDLLSLPAQISLETIAKQQGDHRQTHVCHPTSHLHMQSAPEAINQQRRSLYSPSSTVINKSQS